MILSLNGIIAGKGTPPSTLLTNLVSVYKAENNANDSFGTVNGTGMGGLTYSSGKSGSAFNFNGSTAYVNFADDSFNFTGDFSVNLWIYFPSSPAGAQYDIIQSVRQNSINTGWKFVVRLGKPEFQIYNNSGQFVAWYTAGLDLIANTWYNLSIVKKTGQAPTIMSNGSYYTVGVRASNSSITEAQYTSPCYSVIGAAKYDTASLGNYMPSNSKLDEIGLWNRALTTAEETELYRCGSGNFYPYVSLPTLDSDACAFIGSASITDTTQQSAINQLVLDLKSANLWSKMKAIYPFVGGTASQHRFNLKDPRTVAGAFYIDFAGGVTHSSNGVHFDGATGYADTKLNASANMNQNSTHLSYYSRTNNTAGSSGEIGALTTLPVQYSHMHIYYTGGSYTDKFLPIINTTIVNSSTNMTNSLGHYVGNRASNTIIVGYKNGAVVMNANTNPSTTLPNLNYYIGALNINGTASNYSVRNCAFATIGDGITDADAIAFYNAVQTFQTTLGRQV